MAFDRKNTLSVIALHNDIITEEAEKERAGGREFLPEVAMFYNRVLFGKTFKAYCSLVIIN